jgi:predicted DNA-binding transcriptional regulator YafY
MNDTDIKRISRLIAILTQLQTKKILTSTMLAQKFGVSTRTIFRDLKALEEAGVPIFSEEGKGFSLIEGYKIPPIMFTENEANALVTAEQIVSKTRDSSLSKAYTDAIAKVKAVLAHSMKGKVELLSSRIAVSPTLLKTNKSDSLTFIQNALTSFKVLNITYQSEHEKQKTERRVEPFALYYSQQENWTLIAFCHLRKDYRMFRLDRIFKMELLELNFKPHNLTLKDYLDYKEKNFKHP